MSAKRTARSLSVITAAALLVGASIAPADAAKRKKKKPKAPVCASYVTPEWAGEAETSVVTDAATADAPVEVTIATEPGLGFSSADSPGGGDGPATTFKYHNIVVDTAAPTAKLFARVEYQPAWDYDIFLRTPDGTALAYEADFNPATAGGPTPVGGNEGAHPEPGAGQIDGVDSLDCTGYTLEIVSAITPGGDVTATLWLGE